MDYKDLIKSERIKANKEKQKKILQRIEKTENLVEKCVWLRVYTTPQSTAGESIVKKNLKIDKAKDEVSGDGIKDGVKYEIKMSLHDKESNINLSSLVSCCSKYFL